MVTVWRLQPAHRRDFGAVGVAVVSSWTPHDGTTGTKVGGARCSDEHIAHARQQRALYAGADAAGRSALQLSTSLSTRTQTLA